MIKRAKWKILHDGDGDEEHSDAMSDSSRGSTDSGGSMKDEGEDDAALLKMLLETDKELGAWISADPGTLDDEVMSRSSGDSSSEAETEDTAPIRTRKSVAVDAVRKHRDNRHGENGRDSTSAEISKDRIPTSADSKPAPARKSRISDAEEEVELPAREPKQSSVRTCNLCPAKLLLNDTDVEIHLQSKAHKKAEKRDKKENMSNAEVKNRKEKNAKKRAKRDARQSAEKAPKKKAKGPPGEQVTTEEQHQVGSATKTTVNARPEEKVRRASLGGGWQASKGRVISLQ